MHLLASPNTKMLRTPPTLALSVALHGHHGSNGTRSSTVNQLSVCCNHIVHMLVARPCDTEGNFLPEGTPPAQAEGRVPGNWSPFNSRDEFELADLLFTRTEMSRAQIDQLMQIWGARTTLEGGTTPFADAKNLHDTINAIEEGDVPWHSFRVSYDGDRPTSKVPSWMDDSHQVFYRDPRQVVRNIVGNHKFDGDFDYVPYREYENGEQKWGDFMSGGFCWKQAVCPTRSPEVICTYAAARI